MVNSWKYNDKEFLIDDIHDSIGFVYLITNLLSGKMYVGKRVFKKNWQKYFGSCKDLSKDIEKVGINNFKREIISLHKTIEDLNSTEIKEQNNRNVLKELDKFGEKLYYNKCIGDYSKNSNGIPWNKGIPMTKELKEKISMSVKLRGYKPTKEHIEKMRLGAKNHKVSDAHKLAIKRANTKPRSEETKIKISQKLKGIKLSEDQKKQRSITMKEYWNKVKELK